MTIAEDSQPLPWPPSLLSRVQSLAKRRATWVLADQAIVSAGNFIAGNRLVVYLSQTELGDYGVLYQTMLYFNSLQAAIIVYPLTIKGATGSGAQLGRLATGSILLTLAMLPLLGGATAASVFSMARPSLSLALLAVATVLLWQLQETTRRALMADLRFASCVVGDAIRNLGQAGVIIALGMTGRLNLHTALLAFAGTAALAIIVQGLQLGLKRVQFAEVGAMARDFWRMGRWMLLGAAGAAITSLGYWYVMKWSKGAEECARFQAILELFKLANPIVISMCGLITPAVARACSELGTRAATRVAIRYTALGAGLLSLIFIVFVTVPTLLLKLLYKETSPYIGEAQLLRLFVANYALTYLSSAAGAWLGGLGRARWNFYTQLVNVIMALLVGLPLTYNWGAEGLVVGGLFAASATAVASAFLIRRATQLPYIWHQLDDGVL
jgi:O-antigen/teichoic acid export membrane protein